MPDADESSGATARSSTSAGTRPTMAWPATAENCSPPPRAAIMAFTKSLARSLAPRCASIAWRPAGSRPSGARALGQVARDGRQRVAAGALGHARGRGRGVAFWPRRRPTFITGNVLPVNGGFSTPSTCDSVAWANTFISSPGGWPSIRCGRLLAELAPRVGFDYSIDVLGITVAALMTTDWIAPRLHVPAGTTRVLLPGYCRGDLARRRASGRRAGRTRAARPAAAAGHSLATAAGRRLRRSTTSKSWPRSTTPRRLPLTEHPGRSRPAAQPTAPT